MIFNITNFWKKKSDKFPKHLSAYKSMDFITLMKAGFIYKVSIAMICFVTFLLFTTILIQIKYEVEIKYFTILIEIFSLIVILLSNYAIKKGKLDIAIHTLILNCFIAIWLIIFVNSGSQLSRFDTISLTFGVLSITTLITHKNKAHILNYTILNIIVLVIFLIYIHKTESIFEVQLIDYFIDNLIGYIFIATVAYNMNIIYTKAIKRSESALIAALSAESEVKQLNEELESKVNERTIELNNALIVIEESNIELKDLNESIAKEAQKLMISNENLLKSENELKTANQTKDKFLSIISHDLRGPFSGFLGLTDLMAKEADDLSKEEIKKISDTINKSANSVYRLIDDLLIWSKLQTGSIHYYPQDFELYDIVFNTILFSQQTAIDKKIEIINNIPNKISVCCDKNMIATIIRNLLTNAIKFSYENSYIEIGIDNTNSDTNFSDTHIIVYIKDHGIGINKIGLASLFKIEVHYTTPGTKKETGTGLGLILCKEFVEIHGGKIWVESEEGKGSTFYFSIPLSIRF